MDVLVIAAIALAGALLLSGVFLVRVAARRARRKRERQAPEWISLVQGAVRAGVQAHAKARELAPVFKDSIQTISAWVQSTRPDIESDLADDGTITLLFSDIENSTAINARLGDDRWIEELRAHTKVVQKLVGKHDGHVVKSQGDGFMVAFKEPPRAAGCAVALQRSLDKGSRRREPIRVRVGVHTGSVISEDGDYFGANVAFAARVAQQAHGGEILVSEAVKDLTGDEFSFAAAGEVELKGIPGTHPLYQLEWR